MSNQYFRFKQFTVQQDKCPMKVCTDSCLFGAYIPVTGNEKRILDIGTGTGLLSLMLAQRCDATIDAVEILDDSAEQARDNFSKSPWANRLHVHHTSIQNFTQVQQDKYDVIISNPPFFTNYLKSPDKEVNVAHHTEHLSPDDLLSAVVKLLSKEGKFWVLLPPQEAGVFTSLANNYSMYLRNRCTVSDKDGAKVIREILCLPFSNVPVEEDCIYIKEQDNTYSSRFTELLKPYYLYL